LVHKCPQCNLPFMSDVGRWVVTNNNNY
jgi:hypothetical protein